MIKLFGKKEKEETQEEPQIKQAPLRGPDGKFISKGPKSTKRKRGLSKKAKKTIDKKIQTATVKPAVTITFFGREIKKVYDGKDWYFAVNDIIALAGPPSGKEVVRKRKSFEKVQKKVGTKIEGIVYADADGCLSLIKEVNGVFPGPLARWLTESSKLPYKKPSKIEKKEEVSGAEMPIVNPSDRR